MLATAHPLVHCVAAAAVIAIGGLVAPRAPAEDIVCVCALATPPPASPVPTHPPELYVRAGDRIVRAPAEDQAVAARYPYLTTYGPLVAGTRLTILTDRTRYRVNEEVRVIHALEIPGPGGKLWIMGPKAIHGEYIDGIDVAAPDSAPGTYDGVVLDSPGVDFNYDITTYHFREPGQHTIQWRIGSQASNTITIDVDG
jgi:hypothetical protein